MQYKRRKSGLWMPSAPAIVAAVGLSLAPSVPVGHVDYGRNAIAKPPLVALDQGAPAVGINGLFARRMRKAAAQRGGAFSAQAVVADGTNDYMLLGGGLTGASDGRFITVGAVFKMNGGDGAEQTFIGAANNNVFIRKSDNTLSLQLVNPGASATIFVMNSSSTYAAGATWYTALASVDSTAGTSLFYVNGSSDKGTTGGTGLGGDIDFTDTNWGICARTGGGNKLNADVAYVAMWPAFFDLTNAATLAQFYTDGKPTDWSAVGSPLFVQGVPSGGVAADFATDQGSNGNDYSITGTFALSATTPWD